MKESVKSLVFNVLKTFMWFTTIPVCAFAPRFAPKDKEANYGITRWTYACFPLVGVVVATVPILIFNALALRYNVAFSAVIASVSYLMVTGGIHLDGLSDTVDGLHAFGKDRLAVVKEPQAGAIGVSYMIVWLTLFVATFTNIFMEIHKKPSQIALYLPIIVVFVWSRYNAGEKFFLHFKDPKIAEADGVPIPSLTEKIVPRTLALLIALAVMLTSCGFNRNSWPFAIFCLTVIIVSVLMNLIGVKRIKAQLGFINGDTLGMLICMEELLYLWIFTLTML